MSEPTIRLDRGKPFSEVKGERTPDDPHYRVHFFQGYKQGKILVLLPFDADGLLVSDDGRTEPYAGIVDNKPVMHHPLYTKAMRDMVSRIKERMADAATAPADNANEPIEVAGEANTDYVDFAGWLRGSVDYPPTLLRVAAKAKFSKNYATIPELVLDLVLDERLIPEDELRPDYRKHLPARAPA